MLKANTDFFTLKWFQIYVNIVTYRPTTTIYEELVSKTSYIHPDMLLIYIIDFLLQLE